MSTSRLLPLLLALTPVVACQALDPADEVGVAEGAQASAKLALLAGGLGGPGTTDGVGTNARLSYPEAVVADGRGNLFVADGRTVRKIAIATGEVTTIAGGALGHADGASAAASFDHPTGLALDGAGNLFVSDMGNDSIRKIVLATGQVSTVVAGAANPGATTPSVRGLAVHRGDLYVTSPRENTIRKIALPTGASTVIAGGGEGTADGVAAAARFRGPRGVASDGAGRLFVADTGNHTVRSIDVASGAVTTVAGAAGVAGATDGVGAAARFDEPRSVSFDGDGALLVTTRDNLVRRVVVATGEVTTVAGAAGVAGATDGDSAAARFKAPFGVAVSGGDVFVADTGNNAVRRIAASGGVTTLAGKAVSSGAVDGTGAAALFSAPTGVAIDENDDVFVADRTNLRVRKVTAGGQVTTLAGGAAATAPYDGVGTSARFLSPLGVATDRHGHVFVADGSNIRRIDVATKKVTTLAYLLRDHDIPVFGIAADAERVYVHDRLRVWALSATGGAPTVLAGGTFGSTDGVGASAQFLRIDTITTDASGNLFVVDGGEYRHVRKIVPSTGAVTTLQKLPSDRWDSSTHPDYRGIAVDERGAIFVSGWQDVFRFAPGATTATRFIGSGQAGVKLGALPAALSSPRGLVITSTGAVVVADATENALLVAR